MCMRVGALVRFGFTSEWYAFSHRVFYELNPRAEFFPNWHIELVASGLEASRGG